MPVFVKFQPYLSTIKLSCLQKNNFGHTKFITNAGCQAQQGKSKLIQNDRWGINFYFLISPIDLCQKGRDYVRGGLTTEINSSITTLTVCKADNYGILKEFQSEKTVYLPDESFLDVKVSDYLLNITSPNAMWLGTTSRSRKNSDNIFAISEKEF